MLVAFPAVRPTAPVNVTVTVQSATSVQLSWVQPSDNGGTPLTNYIITYSSAGDHMTINTSNTQSTRRLNGLSPYSTYQFHVSAENAIGVGPASVTVNAMTLVGGMYLCV